ncbi:MAG: hypothetical protein AB7G80_06985 [Dongiaceae bacterium]
MASAKTHPRLLQLIQVTQELIAVIKSENEFLRARDIKSTVNLQEAKSSLTFVYESIIKWVKGNPQAVKAADPAIRARLHELAKSFDAAASENLLRLKAAREVGNTVLEAIRQAVMDQVNPQHLYAAGGSPRQNMVHAKMNPVSVTLNQTF